MAWILSVMPSQHVRFVYIYFVFQVSPKKVVRPRNIRRFGWLVNIIKMCNNAFWKRDCITNHWFVCWVILCGWNQSSSSSTATALVASIYNVSSIICYHVDVMVTVLLPSSQNYRQVIPGADTANQTMTYKLDIFWTPICHLSINSFVYCTWRGGGVPLTSDRMNRTLDRDSVNLLLVLDMWSHGVLPTEWLWTLPVFWNCVS
jgi:hypothetical protein